MKKDKDAELLNLNKIAIFRQKNLLDEISKKTSPEFRTFEGLKIICMPKVFAPSTDTLLLAKNVVVKQDETVLEPFSGSGYISVYLAKEAKHVYSTDINEYAVQNIVENVCLHHFEDKISVFHCDIFPDLNIKYDVIVANPPYTDNKASNQIEKCVWDENHLTVINFLENARKYLNEKGRIYMSWSNFADLILLKCLQKDVNIKLKKSLQ